MFFFLQLECVYENDDVEVTDSVVEEDVAVRHSVGSGIGLTSY